MQGARTLCEAVIAKHLIFLGRIRRIVRLRPIQILQVSSQVCQGHFTIFKGYSFSYKGFLFQKIVSEFQNN